MYGHMKGEMDVYFHPFLTSALYAVSAQPDAAFNLLLPGEPPPTNHWIWVHVESKAGLGVFEGTKSFNPAVPWINITRFCSL